MCANLRYICTRLNKTLGKQIISLGDFLFRLGLDAVGAAGGVGEVAGDLDIVVGEFAELDVVHAELLVLGGGAEGEAGDEVDEEEDEAGEAEGPGEGGAGAG